MEMHSRPVAVKRWLVAVLALTLTCLVVACTNTAATQPSPPASSTDPVATAIPFGDLPGALPLLESARPGAAAELWEHEGLVARRVRNVGMPTLTPVLPDKAKATGTAVIVAPGGAFMALSIDKEGYDVARWLAGRGIAAFVLKYRLNETPPDPAEAQKATIAMITAAMQKGAPIQVTPEALADAMAAVRLVRARSTEWGVDPRRVGFVGFSAGAITALAVVTGEQIDARPDFIAPIYPPMDAQTVPADAPPMFLAIALDDPLFALGRPLPLIDSWRNARRPVEVHLFERGSHGFGMASTSKASALWIDEFHAWMDDRGLLRKTAPAPHANP